MNQTEIAKLANVSSATVSRVINNDPRVSEKTRLRVQKVIEEYAYVANVNARNLRTSSSKSIGFLISNFSNPFFIDVYNGLEPICRNNGYSIIIGNTNENVEQERQALDLFLSYRVDAIVASFVNPSDKTIEKLKRFNVEVLLLDRQLHDIELDTVAIDNVNGAIEQVEYLSKLGHTKIGLIHGTMSDSNGEKRYKGFMKGMKKCNIPVNKDYIVNGNFLEKEAYTKAVELMHLPNPPTALITHNNLMCVGTYKALKDMKFKIPNDVSLMGFDNFEFSQYLQPSITLIDRPISEMGELAGKMVIDRIEGKYEGKARKIFFPVKLKIGESCGAPKNK